MRSNLENFILGPFIDFKRFVTGSVRKPPLTRMLGEPDLVTARAVLSWAGCDLRRCTSENLHTATTSLPPDDLFDLLLNWQLWPRSSFFACPTTDEQGTAWFAYRWYKVMPIVKMRLKRAMKPQFIIYDIVWGIGTGGYHSFLIDQAGSGSGDSAEKPQTKVSIYTTFPPTPLFFEGLHDQMNHDVYRKLQTIQESATKRT